jgi:hypothetical protein
MTHPTQLPPSLNVLFCALQDPVPSDQLVEKAGQLSGSEWQRLADFAIHRHRVGPRVWKALKELENSIVPADVAERLEAEARQATISALVSKAETARVVTALNQINIEPCLLKGWALEEDLSGHPGQRVIRDIDVMIEPEGLRAATRVLQDLGYSSPSTEVFGSSDAMDSFLNFAHHIVFFRPQSQTMVELHLRPFRNRHLYSWENLETELRTPRICDALARYRVPTVSSNFVYLALHGYSHRWKRAKWLLDIPPLLKRLSHADWQRVHRQARDLSISRALGISLLLSRDVLKADVPEVAQALVARADRSYTYAACRRELLVTEPDHWTLRRWLDSHIINLSASPRLAVVGAALETLIVRESDVLPSTLARRFQVLHYVSALSNIPKRLGHRVLGRF